MIKRKLLSLLWVLMMPLFSGCLAAWIAGGAVAGIMVYSYFQGELERKYPADFTQTWQATMKMVEQMEFELDSQQKDAISGRIDAHRANGTPIRIYLEMISPNVTSVRIRVGSEGDQAISEIIHDKIRENLNIPQPH